MNKKLIIIILGLCTIATGCARSSQATNQKVQVETSSKAVHSDVGQATVKNTESLASKEEVRITIASVGDIMMHMPQISSGKQSDGSYDFSAMFKSIQPYIEKADFAVGNLETTLVAAGGNYSGYPMFGAPEHLAKDIKEAGFDMLTTSNNHSLDRQFSGVVNTIKNLDNVGLLHTGTYKTQEDSQKVLIQDIKGVKTAFLAYTYGTNGNVVPQKFSVSLIDKNKIVSDIKKARETKVDMIIASLHFGTEYQLVQNQEQKDLVEFMFQNGVDAILGSHPHVLQPMEMKTVKDIYGQEKQRFVIYSQGNFVSNQKERYKDTGAVINLNIRKDKNGTIIEGVDYIPTWVDGYAQANRRATYEILPLLSTNDYLNHPKKDLINRAFADSTKTLNSANPKIQLKSYRKN